MKVKREVITGLLLGTLVTVGFCSFFFLSYSCASSGQSDQSDKRNSTPLLSEFDSNEQKDSAGQYGGANDLTHEDANANLENTIVSKPLATKDSSFKILAVFDLYSEETQMFMKSGGFENYWLMTTSHFKPSNNRVDPKAIRAYMDRRYPNVNSNEICIIDWEGPLFQLMKKLKPGNPQFEKAQAEYIRLIDLIKEARPNLRVAVYGIPSRVTEVKGSSGKQIRWEDTRNTPDNKWDKLLSHTDFLAPSFYMIYADEQIGHKNNLAFLDMQIETALKYAKRLKKPLYPYVWYRIASSEKVNVQYGRKVIPRSVMHKYLDRILTADYQGVGVSGLIWWDPAVDQADSSRLKKMGTQATSQDRIQHAGRDVIVREYTEDLFN